MDKYDFIKRLDNALSPLSETERESALKYYKELFEDSENENELIEHLGSPEKIAENIIRESGMIDKTENYSESFSKENSTDIPEWKKILNRIVQDKTLLIILAILAIVLITSLDDMIIPLSAIFAPVVIILILKNNSDKNDKQNRRNKNKYNSENTDEFDIPEKKKINERNRNGKDLLLIILLLIFTSPIWIGLAAAALGIVIALIAAAFALAVAFGACGIALFFTGISIIISPAFGAGILLTGIGLLLIGLVILAFIPLCGLVLKLCKWTFTSFVSLMRSVFYTREAV